MNIIVSITMKPGLIPPNPRLTVRRFIEKASIVGPAGLEPATNGL